MDISDYNYGGYENKNNDLKQNVFYTNFSLLDDLNKLVLRVFMKTGLAKYILQTEKIFIKYL